MPLSVALFAIWDGFLDEVHDAPPYNQRVKWGEGSIVFCLSSVWFQFSATVLSLRCWPCHIHVFSTLETSLFADRLLKWNWRDPHQGILKIMGHDPAPVKLHIGIFW